MKLALPLRAMTKEIKDIQGLTLLGKKLGMTQVYNDKGVLIPVTVVEVGPCPVTQVKTQEQDGYVAAQVGFIPQKEQRLSKGEKGHLKAAGVDPVRELKEFRSEDLGDLKAGDVLNASAFSEGQTVDIIATTKGRGFQGVVKRHGFSGGPQSHGSMSHRRGGSYGQCQWPGEVHKGRKMPGHMGNTRCTVQNLLVVKVLEEKNVLLIKGSLPGINGGLVQVRVSKKNKKSS